MGVLDWLFGPKFPEGPAAHNPAGPVLFVVRGTGDAFTRHFMARGYRVAVFAHDEGQLPDKIAATAPACVAIEIESAGASGFHLTHTLKKDRRLSSIPVAVFSGTIEPETFEMHKKLRTRAEVYIDSSDPQVVLDGLQSFLPRVRVQSGNG